MPALPDSSTSSTLALRSRWSAGAAPRDGLLPPHGAASARAQPKARSNAAGGSVARAETPDLAAIGCGAATGGWKGVVGQLGYAADATGFIWAKADFELPPRSDPSQGLAEGDGSRSDPTARWRLDTVARAVHSSPFHLARQFRAVTGESISRYLLRLRLGLALDRIAAGETEFARLAAELGCAHHSHFSARFRSVFGTTPTQARRKLASGRLRELSTIVTAALPAAP